MTSSRVHVPASTEVVLSCPACWSWQLHYDPVARITDGTFGSNDEMEHVIEQLLREHVAHDCPQPLFFAQLAKTRGLF